MKLPTFFLITVLTALFSCNFSNQNINETEKKAQAGMESELATNRKDFNNAYKKLLKRQMDSALTTEINIVHQKINSTSLYIDSLRQEMDKLDNMDTRNVELIRNLFLGTGIGDSIINKLKDSYQSAINVTKEGTDKSRLLEVQTIFSDEMKQNLFQLNSPLGVSSILFGIESELLKDGVICFSKIATN